MANVYVRANAATLFLDAFPLQDPDWSREEIDTVMQKQFDVMMVSGRGGCLCVVYRDSLHTDLHVMLRLLYYYSGTDSATCIER